MEQNAPQAPAELTEDQKKVQELHNKVNVLLHKCGSLAYNISVSEQDIADARLEVKNHVIDINKLGDKIKKEKAAADTKSKLSLAGELPPIDVEHELVPNPGGA